MPKLKQLTHDGTPSVGDIVQYDGRNWIAAPPSGSSGINPTGTFLHAGGINAGDAVYLSADSTVALADANGSGTQPVIGLVKSVNPPYPAAGNAEVQFYGELGGFSGLTAGQTYYLSITGVSGTTITPTPPTAPGEIQQRVGFAKSSSVLVVMVDRDFVVM